MKIADGMSPESDRDLAPLKENGGMMAFSLGEGADLIGEGQRLREIGKSKSALQAWNVVTPDQDPAGNLRFQLLDFRFRYSRRIAAARGASFMSKHGNHLDSCRHKSRSNSP